MSKIYFIVHHAVSMVGLGSHLYSLFLLLLLLLLLPMKLYAGFASHVLTSYLLTRFVFLFFAKLLLLLLFLKICRYHLIREVVFFFFLSKTCRWVCFFSYFSFTAEYLLVYFCYFVCLFISRSISCFGLILSYFLYQCFLCYFYGFIICFLVSVWIG